MATNFFCRPNHLESDQRLVTIILVKRIGEEQPSFASLHGTGFAQLHYGRCLRGADVLDSQRQLTEDVSLLVARHRSEIGGGA